MKTGTIKWFDPLLKNGFIKQDKGDYVVSWKLLNAMEVIDWIDALKEALKINIPDILNTDQGPQFTSTNWVDCLVNNNVKISMNGKWRFFDCNGLFHSQWTVVS